MTDEQYLEIGRRLRERDASLNPDPECCARLVRCVVEEINKSGHHAVVAIAGEQVSVAASCDNHCNFPESLRQVMGNFSQGNG